LPKGHLDGGGSELGLKLLDALGLVRQALLVLALLLGELADNLLLLSQTCYQGLQ
jgi:hypothetical protein